MENVREINVREYDVIREICKNFVSRTFPRIQYLHNVCMPCLIPIAKYYSLSHKLYSESCIIQQINWFEASCEKMNT